MGEGNLPVGTGDRSEKNAVEGDSTFPPLYGEDFCDCYERGNRFSLFSLAVKTIISLLAIFLCTTALSWIIPDARGAGRRYVQNMFKGKRQAVGLMANTEWMEPGGKVVKLEEAVKKIPFTLKFPTYFPGQAALSEVVVYDHKSFGVKCIYIGPELYLIITQRDIRESTLSVALDLDHHKTKETGKEVLVYSHKGIVAFDKKDNLLLSFVDDRGIHFTISGTVDEDEIVKIAHSLKP